jgi:hypothetical protein
MPCLKCGSSNNLREMKGLALTIVAGERDAAIAPGTQLPVSLYFCGCGFIELYLPEPRMLIHGEAIDLPRTNKP